MNIIKIHDKKKFSILEKIKYLSSLLLFFIFCFNTYYMYKTHFFIYILIMFVISSCGILIILSTEKGKHGLLYFKQSFYEMQKIIWPEHKDTLYTTCIVIVVTVLMSFILWSLDSIIFRLIAFIISLRF